VVSGIGSSWVASRTGARRRGSSGTDPVGQQAEYAGCPGGATSTPAGRTVAAGEGRRATTRGAAAISFDDSAQIEQAIEVDLTSADEGSRWQRIRWGLAALPQLPLAVVALVLGAGAAAVTWATILATGRPPAWGVRGARWAVSRIAAAAAAATGLGSRAPSVRFSEAVRLDRRAVAGRWLVGLPVAAAALVVAVGTVPAAVVAWITAVGGAGPPPTLRQALTLVVRFEVRAAAWLLLATSVPPHGLFGPDGSPTASGGGESAGSVGTIAPDVFTYVGPSWLWGYSADRTVCGIWPRSTPDRAVGLWPVAEQAAAWARFRELEPAAVAVPPTAAAELGAAGPPAAPVPARARRLVAAVVATGVLAFVGYGAAAVAGAGGAGPPTQQQADAAALARAYRSLRAAVLTYTRAARQCAAFPASTAAVGCAASASTTVAGAFGRFGRQLDALHGVTGAPAADRRSLQVATAACQQAFLRLGATTTVAGYDAELAAVGVPQRLERFDAAYGHLLDALTAGQ
jgi:hypothetical protein